MYYSRW
jgi:hypothetical protein